MFLPWGVPHISIEGGSELSGVTLVQWTIGKYKKSKGRKRRTLSGKIGQRGSDVYGVLAY
ncbi:hypothetical protein [Endozoicomonas sp. ONNA1]|uniref:hypothetical protein n=1 Tax=Endozoicomonas sp. ONNA1 TaxID=2828740 RepID=UPI002147F234|nr:hypothetical protein [Endozoicomonas sp. ONNA1]